MNTGSAPTNHLPPWGDSGEPIFWADSVIRPLSGADARMAAASAGMRAAVWRSLVWPAERGHQPGGMILDDPQYSLRPSALPVAAGERFFVHTDNHDWE